LTVTAVATVSTVAATTAATLLLAFTVCYGFYFRGVHRCGRVEQFFARRLFGARFRLLALLVITRLAFTTWLAFARLTRWLLHIFFNTRFATLLTLSAFLAYFCLRIFVPL
jgi:hypothetical protein